MWRDLQCTSSNMNEWILMRLDKIRKFLYNNLAKYKSSVSINGENLLSARIVYEVLISLWVNVVVSWPFISFCFLTTFVFLVMNFCFAATKKKDSLSFFVLRKTTFWDTYLSLLHQRLMMYMNNLNSRIKTYIKRKTN